MNKYHYTQAELETALKNLGVIRGDVVFIHSNIGLLGYPREAQKSSDICRVIHQALRTVLGEEGTLIVPTFTYSFGKNEIFEVEQTPSTVGIFTEYIRGLPDSFRSRDPMFSVSAVGAKSKEMVSNISHDCFGKNSVWDRLYIADAAFLNIGIAIGSTFIHYIEETLGVPYRSLKKFSGYVIDDGNKFFHEVSYFVRDLNLADSTPDFTRVDRDARSFGYAKLSSVGKGEISLIRAQAMFQLCQQGLQKDPGYLITGSQERIHSSR